MDTSEAVDKIMEVLAERIMALEIERDTYREGFLAAIDTMRTIGEPAWKTYAKSVEHRSWLTDKQTEELLLHVPSEFK